MWECYKLKMASLLFSALYFLLISLCLAAFTLVFCFLVYLHHKHKTLDHIPGPKRDGFLWGNVKLLQRLKDEKNMNGFQVLRHLVQEHGPVMIIWIFHIPLVYVSDADIIKKVLVTSNFSKDAWSYDRLGYLFGERFMGKGLVTETDHEKWKIKRLAVNQAFHRKYLKELLTQFNSSCDVFLARLTELADGKTEVKMADEFNRITLDIIGKVAFGIDLNAIGYPDSPFPTAIRECLAAPIWCLSHPLHMIDFTSYGYQNLVVSAVHFLRDTGKKIVDERRKAIRNEEEVPSDILSYILKSVNEDNDLDYEELLDHFVTFFIAGQETTSSTLSFMLAEAGKHAEVENRLVQEAEDILGSHQYVSYEDLGKLNYTGLVMKETLRLHPSVPAFTRVMEKDDELGGHQIPAGTLINVGVYALHHSSKHWNDPENFDPERFLSQKDDNDTGCSTHYAYIPFSLGPRHCIGQMFAEFEVKVLMSRLLKSFKFQLVPGQDYGYEDPKATLAPKDRICCTLTLR